MTITPSAILPSTKARLRTATATETITAGKLVYKVDAKTVGKADASVAAKSQVAGVAVNTAAAGQPLTYVERDPLLEIGGAHRIGEVYVSATSGDFVRAADAATGWQVCALGVVVAETKLEFVITATDDVRVDPTPSAPTGLAVEVGVATTWTQAGSYDSHQIQFGINAVYDTPDVDETDVTSPYADPGLSAGNWGVRVRAYRTVSGVVFYSAWTGTNFTIA